MPENTGLTKSTEKYRVLENALVAATHMHKSPSRHPAVNPAVTSRHQPQNPRSTSRHPKNPAVKPSRHPTPPFRGGGTEGPGSKTHQDRPEHTTPGRASTT